MNADESSKTAAQMALSRAIESRREPSDRICFDPLAERFLDDRYRPMLVWPLREAAPRVIELLFPGHHHYVLTRTRYIDDLLDARLGTQTEQLVVLGAGYDSRAYRFADRLRHVSVFEVDHPATSARKRATVERVLGASAPRVTYVGVSFDDETLGDALERRGYRADARTVFLWEGTTPYLSAAGVDATLRFIASKSARGSLVVFGYVLAGVLEGTCTMRGAREEFEKMRRTNEPFTFGIAGEEIESFLSRRGFRDVSDVGGESLEARYLRSVRRDGYVKPWWRIVHASVR